MPVRPTVVSITSVTIFLLGFALTVAAVIAGVGMMHIGRSHTVPSIYVIATLFGLVAGPLFTLSGYKLWKMKKWAAQLAATILLLDLIPFYGIDIRRLLPGIMNIIILVLIALAWKHLRNENLPQ